MTRLRRRASVASLIGSLIGLCLVSSVASAQPHVFSRVDPRLEGYGYVDMAAKWKTGTIIVCWESTELPYNQEKLFRTNPDS